MNQKQCPRCGCKMYLSLDKDVSGKQVWSCTNRGQYGGGACGHIEKI